MAYAPYSLSATTTQRPTGLLARLHIDLPLLSALLILCAYGLIVLYSASDQHLAVVLKQGRNLGLAFILMFLVAQLPPALLWRWTPPLYVAGVVMLLAVLIFGDVGKGARRWLDLGLFRFQPSEILKVVLPMMVARYLADQPLPPHWKRVLAALGLVLLPTLLIYKQPDLGTALLVASAGIFTLFLAGMSWRLIAGFAATMGALMPLVWYYMHDYQRQRVLTFLDPSRDPLGAGYHIIQSQIAIGSGGVFGKGWLNGTQSHLDFLPERSTDFIFAVLSEEFGLFGVLILLGVYLFIILRGLFLASQAQDTYSRLLAGAITLTFFVYVFVNIGMVTGLLPVVGVPLPLISYGGTSLMTILGGFGILMSIHTHRKLLPT